MSAAARIVVRLTPRGGRDSIEGWDGDILRVRVAALPAEGRANAALVRAPAKALGVAPARVSVVVGARGRTKTIAVEGMGEEEVRQRLR
jgi:uncharacterized protein YggU (UPF0235/DUF167 family)